MMDVKQLQELIENEIRHLSAKLNVTIPVNLYLPISYTLNAGGKRLRPLLVLLGYQLLGDNPEEALPAAMAIELFHNFTLLHDDIMDKAEIRRNQPVVHIKFSENSAILSGDVMAFLAYQYLLESKTVRMADIMSLFTCTAREICEGQQMDMDFESRLDVTTDEYMEMIRLKTAVLLGCSLKTGGLLAGCHDMFAEVLYRAGINFGLAFQLQDDFLDVYGDEIQFGKKIGGDIVCNKKTYLLTEALKQADDNLKKQLLDWLGKKDFDCENKINTVKTIFEELKIGDTTKNKINEFSLRGFKLLDNLNVSRERKEPLISLFRNLISRIN